LNSVFQGNRKAYLGADIIVAFINPESGGEVRGGLKIVDELARNADELPALVKGVEKSLPEIGAVKTPNAIVEAAKGAGDSFKAPEIYTNAKGQITNGTYIIDSVGMANHTSGSTTSGKSQFLFGVDADKAVLDAASYADEYGLWKPSSGNPADFADKAKIPVVNGNVGVTGNGSPSNYINVYRTQTNFVHGSPGNL